MSVHVLIGAIALAGVVGAIGGFVLGWIAHREDLDSYHTNQLTYLRARLAEREDTPPPPPAPTGCASHRDVICVLVPMPAPLPGMAPIPGWSPALSATHPAPLPVWTVQEDQ